MKADGPARILIYGTPGIGKTTLASEFPNAVWLQLEDGTPGGIELEGWDKGEIKSFGDVMSALASLYQEEHGYQTVVVDSITELQRLVFAETCEKGDEKGNTKANIEDFGYGKGYVYAQRIWQEFLDGVNALRRDRGMMTVLLAHSRVERFDDPETVSYDRYEIDLHNKSVGAIERDMDAILLLKKPVTVQKEKVGFDKERARGDGGNTVYIHTAGRPAYIAKNRYGMPDKILFTPGKGFDAIAPYLPGGQAPAAVEPEQPATVSRAVAATRRTTKAA